MFHRPHIARVAGEDTPPANDTGKRKRSPASRDWACVAILDAIRLEDGVLVWNERSGDKWGDPSDVKRFNTVYANTPVALKVRSTGYLGLRFFYGWFAAHRVVWACHFGAWPKSDLDHINGDRTDNRIENLREACRTTNNRNAKRRADNSSGHTGVYWHGKCKKWIASVSIGGRHKHLGVFDDIDAAVECRRREAAALGYGPHHGEAA